jgi:Fur family transcriptional regulator, ferric uptake regulator
MKAKDQLCSELRANGFRLTPQRERVIDIFYGLPNGEHLSAEAVYTILKRETTDISLATAYRTLKLLASVGVLREVDFSDEHKQYELVRDEDTPHHHLICVACGLAEEFESDVFTQEGATVAKQLAFEVVDLQIKLYARCLPHNKACPLKQSAPH